MTTTETMDTTTLEVAELLAALPAQCEYHAGCGAAATWRVRHKPCGSGALLCERHGDALKMWLRIVGDQLRCDCGAFGFPRSELAWVRI